MLHITFLSGLAIALAVEMPIGPIALLTIHRTLARGWKAGIYTGLGSATALTVFCLVSSIGLSALIQIFQNYETLFQLAGALIVVTLGIKTLIPKKKPAQAKAGIANSFSANYSTALSIAISNPGTMLLFIGAYTSLAVSDSATASIAALSFGVFCGSIIWWAVLAFIIAKINHLLSQAFSCQIQKIAGLIMTGVGLLALLKVLFL